MSSINFSFISKQEKQQEKQQKINEYNKKALLQVQNIVANQKRMIENQKRFIENQKIAALNQPPKPDVIVKPQPPKQQQSNSNIIKLDVKVNSFKFV